MGTSSYSGICVVSAGMLWTVFFLDRNLMAHLLSSIPTRRPTTKVMPEIVVEIDMQIVVTRE